MTRHGKLVIPLLVIAFAVVLLFIPLPNDYRCPWFFKLFDLGHIPLFIVVTCGLWRVVHQNLGRTLVLAAILAVVTEFGQLLINRSFDPFDVVRSGIGIAIAALFLSTGKNHGRFQVAKWLLVIGLLVWPLIDCGPVLVDAVTAYRSFPQLSNFQSRWESTRWYLKSAQFQRAADGNVFLQLTPGSGKCEIILAPVVRDWSGYRRLKCGLAFTGEPLDILISIRDGNKVAPPQRRFDLERKLEAGEQVVEIDLQDLAAGKQFSPLDLARIQSFHFAVFGLTEPRTVLWRGAWLE